MEVGEGKSGQHQKIPLVSDIRNVRAAKSHHFSCALKQCLQKEEFTLQKYEFEFTRDITRALSENGLKDFLQSPAERRAKQTDARRKLAKSVLVFSQETEDI